MQTDDGHMAEKRPTLDIKVKDSDECDDLTSILTSTHRGRGVRMCCETHTGAKNRVGPGA